MKTIIGLLMAVFLLNACNGTKKTESSDLQKLEDLQTKFATSDDFFEKIELKKQITSVKFQGASEQEKIALFEELKGFIDGEFKKQWETEWENYGYYFDYLYPDEELGEVKPIADSLQKKAKQYADAGFTFYYAGNGLTQISTAHDYYNSYIEQLPTYYAQYVNLLIDGEQYYEFSDEAGVMFEWKKMGELVGRYEDYAKKYPEKVEILEKLSVSYHFFQDDYVTGTFNTPIADSQGNLNPETKTEWERFMKAYPQSPTTKLIKTVLNSDERNPLSLKYHIDEIRKNLDSPYKLK